MEKIKFEVGRRYCDNRGRTYECTKRTDKSVWFGNYRLIIKGRYNVEYVDGAITLKADNYDDIEVQRNIALKELLKSVQKVIDNEPCECDCEQEEEIYNLSNDLKEYLEEYLEAQKL